MGAERNREGWIGAEKPWVSWGRWKAGNASPRTGQAMTKRRTLSWKWPRGLTGTH